MEDAALALKERVSRLAWRLLIVGLCVVSVYLLVTVAPDLPLLWAIWRYDPYEYEHACAPSGSTCVTLIHYAPWDFADPVTKRFVVAGKERRKFPLSVPYIEFPNETGVIIEWDSETHCRIVSNLPPVVQPSLFEAPMACDVVVSNGLYEELAEKSRARR